MTIIAVTKAHRVSACCSFRRGRTPATRAGAWSGRRNAHPFLAAVAAGLDERGIATLRYQFPYMEKSSKRPDPPRVAQAAVRAAVAAPAARPDVPLFAGGKSFGGRMTSQAQAESPLPGVRGLAFLGFPLHPPGRPSTSAPGISSMSMSRCSSCRVRATISRTLRCWSRS